MFALLVETPGRILVENRPLHESLRLHVSLHPGKSLESKSDQET